MERYDRDPWSDAEKMPWWFIIIVIFIAMFFFCIQTK